MAEPMILELLGNLKTRVATNEVNIANNTNTNAHPTNPNSSANIAKIKSLCASSIYKYFCLL